MKNKNQIIPVIVMASLLMIGATFTAISADTTNSIPVETPQQKLAKSLPGTYQTSDGVSQLIIRSDLSATSRVKIFDDWTSYDGENIKIESDTKIALVDKDGSEDWIIINRDTLSNGAQNPVAALYHRISQ